MAKKAKGGNWREKDRGDSVVLTLAFASCSRELSGGFNPYYYRVWVRGRIKIRVRNFYNVPIYLRTPRWYGTVHKITRTTLNIPGASCKGGSSLQTRYYLAPRPY